MVTPLCDEARMLLFGADLVTLPPRDASATVGVGGDVTFPSFRGPTAAGPWLPRAQARAARMRAYVSGFCVLQL